MTITIASGKGGAGKTSIAAALAAFFSPDCIVADCDVDAANGAIALAAEVIQQYDYFAGPGYRIDAIRCTGCGLCAQACRFGAIKKAISDDAFSIQPELCERCGACFDRCPSKAIIEYNKAAGKLFISSTRLGAPLVHAELLPGEDTSGKLVRQVREKTFSLAQKNSTIIVDAPPGIGCPVIASLSGSDLAVIVMEASVSGINDALRLIALNAQTPRPEIGIINKTGLNPSLDERARKVFSEAQIPLAGEIPFDQKLRSIEADGQTWMDAQGPIGTIINRTMHNVAAMAANIANFKRRA
jgi:MinD superfamily P-loop ATPase